MKKELSSSKNMEDVQHEDYRYIQPYFKEKSIENTCFSFRIRTKLVKNIPGNFKIYIKVENNGSNVAIVLKK